MTSKEERELSSAIEETIKVTMNYIFNPNDPYDPTPVYYVWETALEVGRGNCNENMLIIKANNLIEGNPLLENPDFYNQNHLDNYFTLEKVTPRIPKKIKKVQEISRPRGGR